MEKWKNIIYYGFLLAAIIFLALWIFIIVSPFLDYAQLLADLGIPYGGPISVLLEYLFLNVYFIGLIIFGVIALALRIAFRKSL